MPILLIAKETSRILKGLERKVNLSKIKCYNFHKMGHYRNNCLDNPRNKKRSRDQANVAKEGSPKKNRTEELEIKDLYYQVPLL